MGGDMNINEDQLIPWPDSAPSFSNVLLDCASGHQFANFDGRYFKFEDGDCYLTIERGPIVSIRPELLNKLLGKKNEILNYKTAVG